MAPERHFETEAIRLQAERSAHREHSVPIFATSSFVFDDAEQARALFAGEAEGHVYSRYANPNTDEFVRKLCALEGVEDGVATASGMAAMFLSLAAFLNQGDHVVASRSLFGSTHQILTRLLPRWGISCTLVDLSAPRAAWERAMRGNTRMLFVETPSNPGLELADLDWLGSLAVAYSAILNVDNCFATPYLQNPADFGADLVTHSATKLIDGQGRVLGGAVLGAADLIEEVRFMARHTGPAMSPFHGWILSKSLETLAVRVDRHCANALAVAEFLEGQPGVTRVRYPFLPSHPQYELARRQMRQGGSMVTFELAGGYAAAFAFLDALTMISRSSNLGDTRSIATHPASTTHSKLSEEERAAVGITPGLVRLSIGLEHIDDLRADLDRGLAAARAA
ncbi:MAG: O-succinylhomoserine sulfhydrylase [Bacteroidetes bacterium]|nr:O-succinylhomoserine sulfhydrylase [Rhodothermaceae bacterium RA]RMH69456.1 MAG: O-succinylhomoserine sulfhydrylase [Bacteroidota bacterium]